MALGSLIVQLEVMKREATVGRERDGYRVGVQDAITLTRQSCGVLVAELEGLKLAYGLDGMTVVESCIAVVRKHLETQLNLSEIDHV